MPQQQIDVGSAINAGDGEAIRNAFIKINGMMEELYGYLSTNGFDPDFLALNSLLNSKLALMPANRIKANLTGAPAAPDDVTYAALGAALGISPAVAAISSAYSLTATDIGKLFVGAGTFTLGTALAASVLGNGFNAMLLNAGTGIITIDPNSSETVNGAASLKVYPGESVTLVCDGANWRALFASQETVIVRSPAGGTAASLPELLLDLPAEFQSFRLKLEKIHPVSGGGGEPFIRFYIAGVVQTFGYVWSQRYTSPTPGDYSHASAGPVQGAGITILSGAVSLNTSYPSAVTIEIFPGITGATSLVPSLTVVGEGGDYGSFGFGRASAVGRADRIRLGLSGPTNINAGLIYSLTGIRAPV